MFTIFSTPKSFEGHIAIIQRNAIKSWTMLDPMPEIILFGKDKGTSEICKELNLQHVPDIKCNEFGTPLLDDLFNKAQKIARHDFLCYINCDIMLVNDFITMLERMKQLQDKWLVVARRWDVDIKDLIDFKQVDWQSKLIQYVKKEGQLQLGGTDYYLFRKGLYKDVLPFAIGRHYWDNWLIWKSIKEGVKVINASNVTMSIHQNHHNPYTTKNSNSIYNPEVEQNWKLNGGLHYIFQRSVPNYVLTENEIKKESSIEYFRHVIYRLQAVLAQGTYSIRRKLGLYRWWKK